MTDFFLRMAQRTLGTAQSVQPLTLPRFAREPSPLQPSSWESLSEQGEAHADKNDAVDLAVPDLEEGQETPRRLKPDFVPVPKTTDPLLKPSVTSKEPYPNTSPAAREPPRDTAARPEVSMDKRSPEGDMALPLRQHPDEPLFEVPRAVTTEDISRPGYDNDTPAPDNQSWHSDAPLVQFTHPGRADAMTSGVKSASHPTPQRLPGERHSNPAFDIEAIDAGDSSTEQIIKVTIGRIDVRAVHTTPPVAPKKAPYRPHLTLDDYLQQRRRGER